MIGRIDLVLPAPDRDGTGSAALSDDDPLQAPYPPYRGDVIPCRCLTKRCLVRLRGGAADGMDASLQLPPGASSSP